jgi:hypothetical protein
VNTTFEPEDDQPRWAAVYNRIRDLSPGDIATYDELSEWAGVDVSKNNRSSVYQAIKVLQREDHRTMECVPGQGYAVVPASAHADLAKKHNRRAGRQLNKAIGKVQSADRNYLTPAEAKRMDEMETAYAQQRGMILRLEKRVDKTEVAIQEARERDRQAKGSIAQLSQEKDALATEVRKRLARLEQIILERQSA